MYLLGPLHVPDSCVYLLTHLYVSQGSFVCLLGQLCVSDGAVICVC